MNRLSFQIIILVVFIAAMYFLLIRPQKKREKEVTNMRNSISVGDKIITIGGICGKVVKTKDETLVISVGADKTKFEVMRWAVSSIVEKNEKSAPAEKEEESKKVMPKKLKKDSAKKEEAEPAQKETPAEEKVEAAREEEVKEAVEQEAEGDPKEEITM